MAATSIYISEEVKAKLDKAADIDRRKLVDEIEFLCDERIKELNLPVPDVFNPSSDITHINNSNSLCQEGK